MEFNESRQTNLAKSHLISQNTILTLAPQVSQPIQPSQLEILQFASSLTDILWIRCNLRESRPLVFRIYHALIRELGFTLPCPIGVNLLLRDRLDLILTLPCTVLVVEICPLAEVFRFSLDTRTLCDDALDDLVSLAFLFQTLLVQEKSFVLFWGEIGRV
jgi:hypothetical protein